jgi:hypothetical protein
VKAAIAQYVLSLKTAQGATQRAEDRAIYEKYLADAAVILALVETEAPSHLIASAIQQHERLWGHTWLSDDVYKEPSSKWAAVKKCAT